MKDMNINGNIIENLLNAYVYHKQILNEFDSEMDDEESYGDAGYQYHKGQCDMAITWMSALGISPECEYISEKLKEGSV